MNSSIALIPVRWMNAAWKQPLAHACRLMVPLRVLGGVALLRRPLKLEPVRYRPAVRPQSNRLHP